MNDLFLALAEQRRLRAAQLAPSASAPRQPAPQTRLSPAWGQRLAQLLGQTPKLRI